MAVFSSLPGIIANSVKYFLDNVNHTLDCNKATDGFSGRNIYSSVGLLFLEHF